MRKLRKVALLIMIAVMISMSLTGMVHGESAGTYLVKTAPNYYHPVTNEIEDPGQNPGIGQGMTETVLYEKALYEVYPDDSKYITIRFSLMDNISDIRISYQEKGETEYTDVDFEVKKEDKEEYIDDIRFQVPSSDVVVRFEFYVEPMGRDVIFFTTFSDPTEGSGDFVTTEYVEPPEPSDSSGAADSSNGNVNLFSDNMYMTIAFFAVAALLIVIIAFIGYIYYSRKVINHYKKERTI